MLIRLFYFMYVIICSRHNATSAICIGIIVVVVLYSHAFLLFILYSGQVL